MPQDEWAKANAKDIGRRAVREGRAERVGLKPKRKKPKKKLDNTRCLYFGKFKEVPFESVPTWYLTWVLRTIKKLKDAVRRRIQKVLNERQGGKPVCAPAETPLDREYRAIVGAIPLPLMDDPGGDPF